MSVATEERTLRLALGDLQVRVAELEDRLARLEGRNSEPSPEERRRLERAAIEDRIRRQEAVLQTKRLELQAILDGPAIGGERPHAERVRMARQAVRTAEELIARERQSLDSFAVIPH